MRNLVFFRKENNEYANNVDLTTDGDILMNYTNSNGSGIIQRVLFSNNGMTLNNMYVRIKIGEVKKSKFTNM